MDNSYALLNLTTMCAGSIAFKLLILIVLFSAKWVLNYLPDGLVPLGVNYRFQSETESCVVMTHGIRGIGPRLVDPALFFSFCVLRTRVKVAFRFECHQ